MQVSEVETCEAHAKPISLIDHWNGASLLGVAAVNLGSEEIFLGLAMKESFPRELLQPKDLAKRIRWHFFGIATNPTLPWLKQFLAAKGGT